MATAKGNRLEAFLEAMTRVVCKFPSLVVLVAVFFAGVGLWLTATKLGYVSNAMDLIREDAEFRKIYVQYIEEFDITPDLVVVATGDHEAHRRALDWVGNRLADDALFASVDWRLDFSSLRQKAIWHASAEDLQSGAEGLQELAKTLQGQALRWDAFLGGTAQAFEEGGDSDLEEWRKSRGRLLEFINQLESWKTALQGGEIVAEKESSGGLLGSYQEIFDAEREWDKRSYFEFDDGRLGILLIRPVAGDPEAFSPDAAAIARVREVLAEARQKFPDVQLGLTGEPVLDADQVETSIISVAWASGIALTLIVALFLISYREAKRPVLAVLTLIIGTLWTFGIATVLIGHLNIISNAFVAMVLGLGIDFGIQLIGRYEEEISKGRNTLEALCHSVSRTGSAILVGALTTTAAFFTMCFNDFTGLAELGIIAGSGVTLCLIANLTVLPALIWISDRNKKNLANAALATHWRGGLLLKEPGRNNPKMVLGIASAVTLLTGSSAYFLQGGSFDYNLLNLQNPKLESVRTEKQLVEKGQQSINYAVIIADNLDEARELSKKLRDLSTVHDVASAAELIPADQLAKKEAVRKLIEAASSVSTEAKAGWEMSAVLQDIEKLRQSSSEAKKQAEAFSAISEDARDASELLGRLHANLEEISGLAQGLQEDDFLRLTAEWDAQVIQEIRWVVSWLATQSDSEITEQDIPLFLRSRLISPSGKYAIEVYPRENVWERDASEVFVSELRTIDNNVTGTPVLNLEYLYMLRQAFVRAGVLAVGVIFIVMLVHFRSIRLTLLAVVPLLLAVIWTLGLMPLLGLRFNPANIITLPLTVGIGVAYGIYVVDRLREIPGGTLFDTSTGKSVWLSALTTIIGFGSLIQASYKGISSLGLLMTLSVGMCLIAALYVLPTLTRCFLPILKKSDSSIEKKSDA